MSLPARVRAARRKALGMYFQKKFSGRRNSDADSIRHPEAEPPPGTSGAEDIQLQFDLEALNEISEALCIYFCKMYFNDFYITLDQIYEIKFYMLFQ